MPLQAKQQLFIDGTWQAGNGVAMEKHDPIAGQTLWQAQAADADQVDTAIAAARAAFPDWARRPFEQRAAIVEAFGKQLEAHKEELAVSIARETGKPLWEARTEVGAMIGKIAISQTAYHERTGERAKDIPGGRAVLRHRPHGVLAVFGPYNFPGHLPNGHIVPALLAGNTVVFKPSELTPATADLTLQCWQAAGLPAGVINLVQGEKTVGQALAGSDGIDGLLFTGSAATGKSLHKQFGGRVDKILALELGGNNPLVVADDGYDIPAAVLTIIQSAFISGGQRCTCARRLLVPEGAAGDALIDALVTALGDLHVGDPMDESNPPFYGGLATPAAAETIVAAQNELEARGATVRVRSAILQDGTSLLSPGLIDVTGIETADVEHFGPLLTIRRTTNWDDAVAEANNTAYGLSAGLIGGDAALWEDFRLRIRAGIVNWNRQTTGAASDAPFGGIGDSGNHRPSAYYAADYCAWPMASMESETVALPENLPHGVNLTGIQP
ncbi:succinylglutamate-semialdehyde dehydrogenase [Salinisphaera hydrothermalis]|uniref:N-succinylglutamate 5-semialdehyde dehydrogenase n=1 Tax=Salinisphaera hydrothermalis (strain C41B8) TaxID=1304275 RepID=A0A084IL81_SALHC|nr:succinylglutamate-semialdehyde dehydrogenase [Salinisphaera hydrothermalis]KEZ77465.1 succinylglutamic semialdehyde dehydrogenase [Salinisphaera hydrothermalis C41B8]